MKRPRRSRPVPLDVAGLSGRVDVFRITAAVAEDPAVAAWFAGDPTELRSLAHRWFVQMRQCGGDVMEALHDGCPVACIGDAPFAYVNSFKSHVNVGFFYGALLDDPANLLEGSGKRMRHVKLRPTLESNAAALSALIDAAYADIKMRVA